MGCRACKGSMVSLQWEAAMHKTSPCGKGESESHDGSLLQAAHLQQCQAWLTVPAQSAANELEQPKHCRSHRELPVVNRRMRDSYTSLHASSYSASSLLSSPSSASLLLLGLAASSPRSSSLLASCDVG